MGSLVIHVELNLRYLYEKIIDYENKRYRVKYRFCHICPFIGVRDFMTHFLTVYLGALSRFFYAYNWDQRFHLKTTLSFVRDYENSI